MDDAIKIGNLNDPHQRERLILAVAQHLCCGEGCATDGIGCRAGSYREEAERSLLNAPIRTQEPTDGE